MSDIILHHFDPSPFAEKIRLAFGLKGVVWKSVEVPMVMPKPDLTALTGGYRKTPVLQVGADIYCDTRRIATELERRIASPTLFPGHTEGQAFALASWSDNALFRSGAALSMGTNEGLPEDILNDRMAFFDFLNDADLRAGLDNFYAQFAAGLEQLEQMLRDGRPWLFGDAPGWADIACYTPVWMCRGNIADAGSLLESLPLLVAWEQRVAAMGHGDRSEVTAEDALQTARSAQSSTTGLVLPDAWPRLAPGDAVRVTPDDYGMDPVAGSLLRLTHDDIAIEREDLRAGRVVVHFPRAGYKVEADRG